MASKRAKTASGSNSGDEVLWQLIQTRRADFFDHVTIGNVMKVNRFMFDTMKDTKPTFAAYYDAMWTYFRVQPERNDRDAVRDWSRFCLWPAYQMLCDVLNTVPKNVQLIAQVLNGFCAFVHPVHLINAPEVLRTTQAPVDGPVRPTEAANAIVTSGIVTRCSALAGDFEFEVAARVLEQQNKKYNTTSIKQVCLHTVGQYIANQVRTCRMAAVGFDHTVFVDGDGDLYAYGANTYGQLGVPPDFDADELVQIVRITSGYSSADSEIRRTETMPMAKTVACGFLRTAAVLRNGDLAMFGFKTGTGYPSKVQVDETADVRCSSVSCGSRHTVVVTDDGKVYGYRPDNFCTIYAPLSQRKAVSVSCGNDHTAVLLDDGVLLVTGNNRYGQLGVITLAEEDNLLRTLDGYWGAQRFAKVSCGGDFTAALSRTGRLCTFGRNKHGQCGRLERKEQREPGWVDLQPVFDVACGEHHIACVAGNDRQLFTCGKADEGQLGHGVVSHYDPVIEPRRVLYYWQGGAIEQITCGASSTAVVTNQGKIFQTGRFKAWGILWNFAPKVIRDQSVRTINLEVRHGEQVMAVHNSQVSTMFTAEAFNQVVRDIAAQIQGVYVDTGHHSLHGSGPEPQVALRW